MAEAGLNPENYARGFLVDEELMGGVTEHPEQPGTFVAFVLRHTTGEYLGYQPFASLAEALARINAVQRPWSYERVGGCGGCADGSGCGQGQCGRGACGAGGGCAR
jgi:hypothetical protein